MKLSLLLAILTLPLRATEPPHVVLLLADDLGYADMSFLPQSPADVSTPNIDRIAGSGTYFSQAYGTAPICSPSRVGLITGRYQQRWGNYWYGQGGLPATETTIPQMLKELGYSTKKIGKNHNNGGKASHPLDHGFDEFLGFLHHTWDYLRLSEEDAAAYNSRKRGAAKAATIGPLLRGRDKPESYENRYTTDIFAEEAVEFLNRKHDKPFYLHLSFNAVHHPTYVNDPDLAEKFGAPQEPWNREAKDWNFPFWDPHREAWNVWHRKWGHLGKVDPHGRHRYLACLAGMDLAIGRILDTLENNKLRDNTLVILLADNGGTINTYSNNSPLRGHKYMFGEGGIRIPMILSYPGTIPAGETRSLMSSSLDLLPTIAALTGANPPPDIDGRSLLPILRDASATQHHDHLCWADGKQSWVIRQGPWKLISSPGWDHTNFKLKSNGTAVSAPNVTYPKGLHLFNLETDPGETTNLAGREQDRVQSMTTLYKNWRKEMGQPVKGSSN